MRDICDNCPDPESCAADWPCQVVQDIERELDGPRNAHTPSAESAEVALGSTSTCRNCLMPIVYADRYGWIHPHLVDIGVLGGDGAMCDITPAAEPSDLIVPPASTNGGA